MPQPMISSVANGRTAAALVLVLRCVYPSGFGRCWWRWWWWWWCWRRGGWAVWLFGGEVGFAELVGGWQRRRRDDWTGRRRCEGAVWERRRGVV